MISLDFQDNFENLIKNAFYATHYFKNNIILHNGTEKKSKLDLIFIMIYDMKLNETKLI